MIIITVERSFKNEQGITVKKLIKKSEATIKSLRCSEEQIAIIIGEETTNLMKSFTNT